MTSAATAPPPRQPARQQPAPAQPRPQNPPQNQNQARHAGADTPTLITRRIALAIAACLYFGAVSLFALFTAANAMDAAGANTNQLIRVQTIQSQLLRADALATNAFLVGGQESREQRQAYDQAIATADRLIVDAAEAQPADEDALAALNDQVVRYTSLMEQARATNRQGLPVGAAYLSEASTALRADAMPILDALVESNNERVDSTADGAQMWPIIGAGLLTLLILLWIMRWTARRFRRRQNIGLLIAAGAVLLTSAFALFAIHQTNLRVADTREGSLLATRAAAAAGTAVFDAKAYESLTLVARGSGASYEKSWQAAFENATNAANRIPGTQGAELKTAIDAYGRAHSAIRSLDDGGSWDKAVAAATDATGESNESVTTVNQLVTSITNEQGAEAQLALARQAIPLRIAGVLGLLAGLAAAVFALRGLNARLKEYR